MIDRKRDRERVRAYLDVFPVTAILGARQVGKSTLAKQFSFDHFFDLENPRDLARLDHPQLALENLRGLVVIDEIQRKPELFPLLRYLVDERPDRKYLILGSASRDLIRQSSESLAGRIGYYELGGFGLDDVGRGGEEQNRLWLRGGFPRSYLESGDEESALWRQEFIRSYLERDIPQLGITIPSSTLGRFWSMIAHYHGQILNYQELSRSFGVSDATIRRYLEILEGTFMIRIVKPWFENSGKRLVKAPKLYIRDSGIFHTLLKIGDRPSLESHPKLGASWEGFVIEQAIREFGIEEPWFYRTHGGAELDLFWEDGGLRYGIEAKYADAPRLTPSMKSVMVDLSLHRLTVVYPGNTAYDLAPNIRVVPLVQLGGAA